MIGASPKERCDDCGDIVGRAGMASHRRGGRCAVTANIRRMEARGYVKINATFEHLLRQTEYSDYERGPGAYIPAERYGEKSKVEDRLFVRPWVALLMEHVPDTKILTAMISKLMDRDDLTEGAETLLKLGDKTAAFELLRGY